MNVYKNGQLTNSITTGLSDSTLVTGIRGGGEHAATNSQVYIDNVAVYDGVLNGNDFAYLSQHAMPAELVPEPGLRFPEPAGAGFPAYAQEEKIDSRL